MATKQLIANELLAFVKHAIDYMNEVSILQICKSSFKEEEVPYYVKENFHTDYQGSLRRLEMAIEEEYIVGLRHACQRERNYRDSMVWKARNFGDSRQYADAQKLRTPSCEKLQKYHR